MTSQSYVSADQAFEAFWAIYPRRIAKKPAKQAYIKALVETTPDVILEGVKRYISHIQAENIELKYICHPASWLNQGRYDDDLEINIPKTEHLSTEESRHRARVATYNATGKWLDEWGAKPQGSVSNVVDLFSRIA